MLTGLAIYFGGMVLTALLVLMASGGQRQPLKHWAVMLTIWPITIMASVRMALDRKNGHAIFTLPLGMGRA